MLIGRRAALRMAVRNNRTERRLAPLMFMTKRRPTRARWAFFERVFSPPISAGRGKPSANREQGKLELGDEPANRIYTKEKEKQKNKKKHVVECTHNRLVGAIQGGGDLPAYGGLMIHQNAKGRTCLALQCWCGRPFCWPDFGISHGTTIAANSCRRYGAFTPFWMTELFCRHTAYIGGN
jgi:hypothetical protein